MNPFFIDPPICDIEYTCEMQSSIVDIDLCNFNDGSTRGKFDSRSGDY